MPESAKLTAQEAAKVLWSRASDPDIELVLGKLFVDQVRKIVENHTTLIELVSVYRYWRAGVLVDGD